MEEGAFVYGWREVWTLWTKMGLEAVLCGIPKLALEWFPLRMKTPST